MKRIFIILTIFILGSLFTCVFAAPVVKPGIDQFNNPLYLNQLKNMRIGLLTNSAGVNAAGVSTIDILFHDKNVHLVELFSAEHGLREYADDRVADNKDPVTHLPVYSLYGPRKVPTASQFAQIDAIVIDLQDVGLRYYTYATTMARMMKAAKHYNKLVVILDRPNPLGGDKIEGPLLNQKFTGKIAAYYPLPMRHGLTFGELAEYYNRYFHIHCRLLVIPMQGWQRLMLYNQTGLRWHAPSPALPTFKQAFLYGMFGALESLNLAVGRSQNNRQAFEIYGAPWIKPDAAKQLVKNLNQKNFSGMKFKNYQWTPNRGIYKNKLCHGFRVKIIDLSETTPFKNLLTMLEILYQHFGNALEIRRADGMIGQRWVTTAIENNMPASQIMAKINEEQQDFLVKRKTVLLYR